MEPHAKDVLGMVAHDLKHPVFCIQAYAELLLRPQPIDAGAREAYLTRILSASRWAEAMIRDLTDTLAMERGCFALRPEPVSPADLILEATKTFEVLCRGKGADLAVTVRPGPRRVMADRVRLLQVLHNLLANALRHVPQNTGKIAVRLHELDAAVLVEVADNGDGIEREHQTRIFQRFYRVQPDETAGAGLGLFIAKRVIEQGGGAIWVESEGRGKGCRFFFSLPACRTAHAAETAPAPPGGDLAAPTPPSSADPRADRGSRRSSPSRRAFDSILRASAVTASRLHASIRRGLSSAWLP
ncbi:MAG: HAMP domain-containing histidine kinase [Elusimicrobia bacterium]|nr:HAMP domain-containing histidine kinase [Elusimicrobiota bacterium]